MPVRIQRVGSLEVAAVVSAASLAVLAGLYVSASVPPETPLIRRLAGGEGWRSVAGIAGLMALLWGGSSLIGGLFQRRQLSEIDAIANGLGLQRVVDAGDVVDPDLDLPVLRRQMTAVIRGTYEGSEALIGRYMIGSERPHASYVVCFRLPRRLPAFTLTPRRSSSPPAATTGITDVELDNYPGFASRYQLRSTEESAARTLFSQPRLAERLASDDGWYAECNGAWLGLYRLEEEMPRTALPGFLQRATPVYYSLLGR